MNVVWYSKLRLLIVDYMPVKTIETISCHKNTSLFFYNANQLNNEIERNTKEWICHWKIKFSGEHYHSRKCNAGVGFSKCWFAVVTSVTVVVAAREMVSHG